MTQTAHSLGRVYIVLGAHQGAGSPLVDRAVTNEREGAMRSGYGLLFRLPFTGNMPTRGLVVGVWRRQPPPRTQVTPPEQGQ